MFRPFEYFFWLKYLLGLSIVHALELAELTILRLVKTACAYLSEFPNSIFSVCLYFIALGFALPY